MNVTIIGSTGFLGRQVLEVISNQKNQFKVFALACERNYRSLLKQGFAFSPRFLVIANPNFFNKLKREDLPLGSSLLYGEEGVMEICAHPEVSTVFFLSSGTNLLFPLLLSIEKKKKVCLANKELVVSFGKFIFDLAKKKGVEIIPIDSEISGIFQCLKGKREGEEVEKVLITSSGGPLFKKRKSPTLENCLSHPVWRMGKKITIDSATLMNKGFEVIEAVRFFSLPADKISVVIHPQVILHALVQFSDGRILASLSKPDMHLFLQYALLYPDKKPSWANPLDLSTLSCLEFFPPDLKKFPCLNLAYQAIKKDGSLPVALTAADEVAVSYFLKGKIKFSSIPKIIEETLSSLPYRKDPSLRELLAYEREAREVAKEIATKMR